MRNEPEMSATAMNEITQQIPIAHRVAAPPPPPMPTATPIAVVPKQQSSQANAAPAQAEPAGEQDGGWAVDADNLGAFTTAIDQVRAQLEAVRQHVDRMGSTSLTPRLGTSPVGMQLEQKFIDRLDTPLDSQEKPTSGGLRPMLREAMRRMEDFVTGAEAAVKAYLEHDQAAAQRMGNTGRDG
jgi:hypothetical protein